MAELERAKQASRAACIAEISSHLSAFAVRSPGASYEAWIAELHPESLRSESLGKPVIDYRYYLEDSDHRVLWNAKVGAARTVLAREPSREPHAEVGTSPFPPGVDVSVPLLIPQTLVHDGFRTNGGFSGSYVPPPPNHRTLLPGASWQPLPIRDVAPWMSRSYVSPIDPLQRSRLDGGSWVAAASSSGSFVAAPTATAPALQYPMLSPSSWLPPRTAAQPSAAPQPSRLSFQRESLRGSAYVNPAMADARYQDALGASRRVPPAPQRAPPAVPMHWQPRASVLSLPTQPALMAPTLPPTLYYGQQSRPSGIPQAPQFSLPAPPTRVPVASYALPAAVAPQGMPGYVRYHG